MSISIKAQGAQKTLAELTDLTNKSSINVESSIFNSGSVECRRYGPVGLVNVFALAANAMPIWDAVTVCTVPAEYRPIFSIRVRCYSGSDVGYAIPETNGTLKFVPQKAIAKGESVGFQFVGYPVAIA